MVKKTSIKTKSEKKKPEVKKKKQSKGKQADTKVTRISISARIRSWLKSVRVELSKVTWPSKNEMIKFTIATLVFIIFFATYFSIIINLMAFIKSMI